MSFKNLISNSQLEPTQNAKLACNTLTSYPLISNNWYGSAYSPELGVLVVGSVGSNPRLAVTNDGSSWTQINTDIGIGQIAYSPQLKMFVCSKATGTANVFLISKDGYNWSTVSIPGTNLYRKILWVPEKGFFISVAQTSTTTNKFIKSTDGINWTGYSTPGAGTGVGLAYSPSLDLFVAPMYGSSTFYYSSNGENWSSGSMPNAQNWHDVQWSNERKIFVCVSESAITNNIAVSTNGTSWTNISKTGSSRFGAASYSPELGFFLAVCLQTGTSPKTFTSVNGISWTEQAITSANSIRSVSWIKDLGVFVYAMSSSSEIIFSKNIYKKFNNIGLSSNSITATYRNNTNTVALNSVTASLSEGSINYQWEKSTDGGSTYLSVEGATTNTLTLNQSDRNDGADNSHKYRLKMSSNSARNSPVILPEINLSELVVEDLVYTFNYSNVEQNTGVSGTFNDVTWVADKGLFIAAAWSGNNRVCVSPNGVTWNSVENIGGFSHTTYAFNTIYAFGSGATTFTSTDGANWYYAPRPTNSNAIIWDSAYSPSLGMLVLANSSNNSIRTTNGTTWSSVSIGAQTFGAEWSSELGLFVCVGNNFIRTSADGVVWTVRTSPANSQWVSVAWSSTLNLFVAVANSGANRIMTSSDGITWTARAAPNDSLNWRRVKWISDLGTFVAVSETTSVNNIMYSTNGTSWTLATVNSGFKRGIAWSSELKKMVFVGASVTTTPDIYTGKTTISGMLTGPSDFVTYLSNASGTTLSTSVLVSDNSSPSYQWQSSSDNGSTWSNISGETASNFVLSDNDIETASTNSIKYRVTATSAGTNSPINGSKINITVYSDSDYKVSKWTLRQANPNFGSFGGIAWSPGLSLFSAVGNNALMTSPDGITWTSRTPPVTAGWLGVAWSPSLGMFASVAISGTGNRVMTSTDGITWTARAAADNAKNWESVCWSQELGIFVAVASSGTGNRVMTSSDGITWTSRSSAANNPWRHVKWSPTANGTGLFVAIASSGTTSNIIMTSPDGITWTSRTAPNTNQWYGLEWSPDLGLFVAVSITGTGNRAMSSSDGITWTSRNTPANVNWNSVAWSSSQSLFVAVANTGEGNRIMTSSNGISWTIRTSPKDEDWRSIAYSSSLDRFVAVSTGPGQDTRVMTSSNIP